jgi:hypothetical protein
MDRLAYVSNIELSKLFIRLLTNASSRTGLLKAHPVFIHVIDRISSDEAKIIKEFSTQQNFIVSVSHSIRKMEQKEFHVYYYYAIANEENILDLDFPDAIPIYVENLTSLGLIRHDDPNFYFLPKDVQEAVSRRAEELFGLSVGSFVWNGSHQPIGLTNYGQMFIEACND